MNSTVDNDLVCKPNITLNLLIVSLVYVFIHYIKLIYRSCNNHENTNTLLRIKREFNSKWSAIMSNLFAIFIFVPYMLYCLLAFYIANVDFVAFPSILIMFISIMLSFFFIWHINKTMNHIILSMISQLILKCAYIICVMYETHQTSENINVILKAAYITNCFQLYLYTIRKYKKNKIKSNRQ